MRLTLKTLRYIH